MSDYDTEHWDWIRSLINPSPAPITAPAMRPAPVASPAAAPAAVEEHDGNVYTVTRTETGLASYQPVKGNWR